MSGKGFDGTKKEYTSIVLFALFFFMMVLTIVVGMSIKNSVNLRSVLVDSVKSQLISISLAAREMMDSGEFAQYDDESAVMLPSHQVTLYKLRRLAQRVGASVTVLKRAGDGYVRVFSTNMDDASIFASVTPSGVQKEAFSGRNAADVMTADNNKGTANIAAVPVFHSGRIVGVVSAEREDTYLESSYRTAFWNSVMLIAFLTLSMLVMLYLVVRLLRRIKTMQGKLEHQALYDTITGLPNRQYLLDHLAKLSSRGEEPFAMFFIDLDNFKTVNDSAGHDAGDGLLKQIAKYLETSTDNALSFRPAAGQLNIAARVGGDEFIQIVDGLDTEEKASEVARQLLEGFNTAELSRFIEKFNVGLSIGIALYPHHTSNYHVLIKYADIAMYHAKHGGKNQYRFYSDEMGQKK